MQKFLLIYCVFILWSTQLVAVTDNDSGGGGVSRSTSLSTTLVIKDEKELAKYWQAEPALNRITYDCRNMFQQLAKVRRATLDYRMEISVDGKPNKFQLVAVEPKDFDWRCQRAFNLAKRYKWIGKGLPRHTLIESQGVLYIPKGPAPAPPPEAFMGPGSAKPKR
jgi:hypothetical protein